jgi:thioredoxin-related protein
MLQRLLPLILLLLTSGALAGTRSPDTYFFNQSFGDLKSELANAKKAGKKGILIMFEMDNCPYCQAMRDNVLSRRDVQDYYRKYFVSFAFDIKGDTPLVDFNGKSVLEKQFSAAYQIKTSPTFQFFDIDGKPTAHFTGVTKGGAGEFLALGHYVLEGSYKKGAFADYWKKLKD